jgi:ketosteroid isomerase-like protein
MSQRNVELARRGYEAVIRGEFESIRDLLAPDVKWHGGDPSWGCQNRAQVIEFMRRPARGIAGLIEIVDAGEQVVVIMRSRRAGGEPGHLIANLTAFRDGKVVEMVHFDDPERALAAAGVATPDS